MDYRKNIIQIIDALAHKPEAGLVIYGAGMFGRELINELTKYGISPLCVCDVNERLYGTEINGIEVIPIAEAKNRFCSFLLYIASGRYLYEIIYQLLESGHAIKDQIINYEPVTKIYSCKFLQERCTMMADRLEFCCSDFGRCQSPSVCFDGDYDNLVNEFFALRKKIISELGENIPNACSGCRELTDIYVPLEREHITLISVAGSAACNFRCVYCVVHRNQQPSRLKLSSLVQALRKKGGLAASAACCYVNGEITIHPERKETYECLRTFAEKTIFTNALIYDPDISELLKLGNTLICVSIDAGTQETFAKIKGLDVFDRVCGTLRQYAKANKNAIVWKYILLPNINDNETEINEFFKLVREIGARSVIVSSDHQNPSQVTGHTIRMAEYFRLKAEELSIPYESYSDIISDATGIPNTN